MTVSVPVSADVVRDIELLVRSGHALLLLDGAEHARIRAILQHIGDRLRMPFFEWQAHAGLVPHGQHASLSGTKDDASRPSHEPTLEPFDDMIDPPRLDRAIDKTIDPERCLEWIGRHGRDAIVFVPGLARSLDDEKLVARLRSLADTLGEGRGTLVFTTDDATLPPTLARAFTSVSIAPLSTTEYQQYISALLRDLRTRTKVEVALGQEEIAVLLDQVRGLTLFEVRKVITQAVVEDGRLDASDMASIHAAKRAILERSGILEYYPAESTLSDVAGLATLKGWLAKRKSAFADPKRARAFGIAPPKGLLLVGVQGCGKSLCAKAVAADWQLPLVRLDPSSLYNKFVGESEKNLGRATKTAEALAPVVLWIDEIEKAFASAGAEGSADAGLSQRIFGTFLTWLNDKSDGVFVVATANDVSRLPPELVRKGRFDEIFFLDLPSEDARRALFAMHIGRRGRDASKFDVARLAGKTDGFSGAEIEQAVVAGLYTAFAEGRELDTDTLLAEIAATRPLTMTMAERINALRAWATERAVRAE